MHIETLDSAVIALESLGLVRRDRRRINYFRNLPNLWSLTGVAALYRITDTSTNTSLSTKVLSVIQSTPRAKRAHSDFEWPGVDAHPALAGLSPARRDRIAEVFERVRDWLEDSGVESVPQGGWLVAIRDYDRWAGGCLDIDDVDRALCGFKCWRDEGGPLAYSFAWMHKYRGVSSPPPSMIFGKFFGDGKDRSEGGTPFDFWLERGAEVEAAWRDVSDADDWF